MLPHNTILLGDALQMLQTLPSDSMQCCVTSPPYWQLRDYGVPGQYGLEKTPEEYVHTLVAVFHEVRRVLRADGTLWLIIGDTYNQDSPIRSNSMERMGKHTIKQRRSYTAGGCKRKDLLGIPWMLATALRNDGWYLRAECIWSKPKRPEGRLSDRPDRNHESIFLLSERPKYQLDYKSIAQWGSVWNLGFDSFTNHPAVFPVALAKRCILASTTSIGDTVIDPFAGSGTTLVAAASYGRDYLGIELVPYFQQLASRRLATIPHYLWREAE